MDVPDVIEVEIRRAGCRAASDLRVLHVSPTWYPATEWGGPIQSTHRLCSALAAGGRVQVDVLTGDAASPNSNRALDVRLGTRIELAPRYSVRYERRQLAVCTSAQLLSTLMRMIPDADVVHLTGVYNFTTFPTLLSCRRHAKPLVWSPRGALQRWSGSRKKGLKAAWDRLALAGLERGRSVLHVTSEDEARESTAALPGTRAVVIPNGVDVPVPKEARARRTTEPLGLLYMGRLDPKKGIERLLEAVALLDPDTWRLEIMGDGEASYVDHLRARAAPLGGAVVFLGHLTSESRRRHLAAADLMVVPSFTENFGMVVAEGLAHGVPVVASTGTPWSELVDRGCGWWVENSPSALAGAIREAVAADLPAMGRRGVAWMTRDFSWQSVATRMAALYSELADATARRA